MKILYLILLLACKSSPNNKDIKDINTITVEEKVENSEPTFTINELKKDNFELSAVDKLPLKKEINNLEINIYIKEEEDKELSSIGQKFNEEIFSLIALYSSNKREEKPENLNNERAFEVAYKDIIKNPDQSILKILVNQKILQLVDLSNNTLLHRAIYDQKIDLIKFLIEKGFFLNARNIADKTPLYVALEKAIEVNNSFIVKKVIEYMETKYNETALKEIVNQFNLSSLKQTCLHLAMLSYKLDLIKILIEKGADIEIKNGLGKTSFYIAVEKALKFESLNILKKIIKYIEKRDGENSLKKVINIPSLKGTILELVLSSNFDFPLQIQLNLLTILIEKGAHLNIFDEEKSNLIQIATLHNNDVEILNLLISYIKSKHETDELKKMINHRNINGENALYIAIKNNNLELVEFLLNNELIVKEDHLLKSSIFIAIGKEPKILELLYSHSYLSLRKRDMQMYTLLQRACLFEDLEMPFSEFDELKNYLGNIKFLLTHNIHLDNSADIPKRNELYLFLSSLLEEGKYVEGLFYKKEVKEIISIFINRNINTNLAEIYLNEMLERYQYNDEIIKKNVLIIQNLLKEIKL